MAKFLLKIAAGQRGAVITKEINPNAEDPWPGALMTASRLIKTDQGMLTTADEQVTILLSRVEEPVQEMLAGYPLHIFTLQRGDALKYSYPDQPRWAEKKEGEGDG